MLTRSNRCLVVGQAPSSKSDTVTHEEGTWRRFMELCGIEEDVFRICFETVNLNAKFNGSTGDKGHVFDSAEGKETALKVREQLLGQTRHVVLLGQLVASCFPVWWRLNEKKRNGVRANWVHESDDLGGDLFVHLIPHPSGVVQWWNDQENVSKAEEVLQEIARQTISMVLMDRIREKAGAIGTSPEEVARDLAGKLEVPVSKILRVNDFKPIPTLDTKTSLLDEIGAMLRGWIRAEVMGETTGIGAILTLVAGNPLVVGIIVLVAAVLGILLK